MAALPYRIVDADNHFYDADDCFTRHVEARFRERTVRVVRDGDDRPGRMFVGDQRLGFLSVAVGDHVGPPGMMRDFLEHKADSGAVNASAIVARKVPEFVDRRARLAVMDRQRVEACIMLPTLGIGVEPQLRRDREALYPCLRAYNRWLCEEWGFGGDGRIFAPALLSFADPALAVAELERLRADGVKAVIVTPGPIDGRSPADPVFDPIWARLEEARVAVIYHVGASDFARLYAQPWGETPDPPSHRHSALQLYLALGQRPVADTLAALVLHNLFGRFPRLRVLSLENGSAWLAPLIKQLDDVARMDGRDMWRFGRITARPSELLREHLHIAPYPEDDIGALVATVGAGRVLFGSDYPHPEGLAEPMSFTDKLGGLSDADVRRIMRDNAAELLGLASASEWVAGRHH